MLCHCEHMKWGHDGDGKNSLAAKEKEKKTDVWQEYLLYHGRQLSDWSSNEQIHWRTWTVAYFDTLQEATLIDNKLKYQSSYEKHFPTDLQHSGSN